MTGWSADGRTRPTWRSCAHEYANEGRCADCNAKQVHAEPQNRVSGGGVPIGSPLLIKPDLAGPIHRAGPERVVTFNGRIR